LIKKLRTLFADKISHLKSYATPDTPGQTISRPKEGDPVLDEEMATSYRSGVGMLLYLLKHSRIDLGNPVRELTKVLKSPTLLAYKEMLRIIKFVLDMANMGIKLVPTFTKGQLEWRLLGASDSDWANDKDNRKSIMAFILFLNGIPILWRSKEASIVALSTAEAEYIALSNWQKKSSLWYKFFTHMAFLFRLLSQFMLTTCEQSSWRRMPPAIKGHVTLMQNTGS